MNTSLVLTLDKRRAKKDGSYPVIIRISHYERSTSFTTGISVMEKDWDFDKKIIRKTYTGTSSVTRLNNFLSKQKIKAIDIINRLKEEDKLRFLSITQLKERLTASEKVHSFFAFAEKQILELKSVERIGSAKAYKMTVDSLKDFHKAKDLSFEILNYDFLVKFENHHLTKGNSYNGLGVYMRTIRAIYNKAIKSGIIEKELYPFDKYKIKSEPTEKRAIEGKEIKKILKLQLTTEDTLFHARNYFITSYLMCGMSFIDMSFLRLKNLEKGRINYRRAKTSKLYDFIISEQLQEILNFYTKGKYRDDFVFPIIKTEDLESQYRNIESERRNYNKRLKQLAERCKIKSNLTSYVSRHSFATHAMLQNIPLSAISQMLGHSSLTTTQIYLKSLPNNIMDDYLKKMQIK